MRWLVGSVADWMALFKEAYKCCKPSGWVESYEVSPMIFATDGAVPEDSALGQWGPFSSRVA